MGDVRRILAVVLIIAVYSCAEVPVEETPELVWPLPPQKPRVRFLDLIIGSDDVTAQAGDKLKKLLFGSDGELLFRKPSFVAVKNDVLYISDLKGVLVFDFRKKDVRVLGWDLLSHPAGIDVSSNGEILIADTALKAVFLKEAGLDETKRIGHGTIESPGGVAFDEKNGRLVVADLKAHTVNIYGRDGALLFKIGKRGTGNAEFNFPYDVAVDDEGNIYVVDSGNFRVQVFDSEGTHLRSFGSVGIIAGQFARPKGIALDSNKNIYVVDAAFGNFQIFSNDGRVLLSVGSNGTEPGQFVLPLGVAIDNNDKIYVTDQINKRIQVFQYIKYDE